MRKTYLAYMRSGCNPSHHKEKRRMRKEKKPAKEKGVKEGRGCIGKWKERKGRGRRRGKREGTGGKGKEGSFNLSKPQVKCPLLSDKNKEGLSGSRKHT